MKELKYYHEVLYTYSNYRGILTFKSNSKINTKSGLEDIKEHLKTMYEERMGENLMITNIITVLNK